MNHLKIYLPETRSYYLTVTERLILQKNKKALSLFMET